MSDKNYESWLEVYQFAAQVAERDFGDKIWARVMLTDTLVKLQNHGDQVLIMACREVLFEIGGPMTPGEALAVEIEAEEAGEFEGADQADGFV
jgi:hypothetical protein